MSAVLCGFLEYISRDRLLKRKYGAKVCRCLLSQWSLLGSWWGETFDSDRRLAAINILKKVLNLEPKVGACATIILHEDFIMLLLNWSPQTNVNSFVYHMYVYVLASWEGNYGG